MYDIIIIGAGIVGSILAKDLSRYHCKVGVLDKENDVANETSSANSAIIHTGYDPEDNTLKAKLNVEGAKMYESLCRQLHCKYKTVGAYVVACGEEEEKHLDVLAQRARKRNIPFEWLSGDEARTKEKNLSDSITKVLNFYTTAVVYPWQIAIGCMEIAVNNGVDMMLNHEVLSIDHKEDKYIIHTNKEDIESKIIINASGIFADKIDQMVSQEHSFTMNPRRGEYYVLDNDISFVEHIIFPVPSKKGKGVLAVPTVYGNTLLGPNAEEATDNGTSREGLAYVKENLQKTLKNVPYNKVIRTFAGLRPSSNSKDFLIFEAKDAKGFINVASIESPGLASAPAISKYVIERFISELIPLDEDATAVMTRKKPIVMKELSDEERNQIIHENPLYGKIICRCESISEGEIVDCIHGPVGARSVKGVKKRIRPGMGRCQGGFCEPHVIEILARELGIDPIDVVLDTEDSNILLKENRP